MVRTSNWPPLVAMSVVTFWRSTFSSSVTHSSEMSGLALVKSSVSFCMRTMSPLLTVAMVSFVSARAVVERAAKAKAPRTPVRMAFIDILPYVASICFFNEHYLIMIERLSQAVLLLHRTKAPQHADQLLVPVRE